MRSPLLSLPNIWVIAVTQWYRFNKTHLHMALSRGLPHVDPFYFEILPMWEISCASDMFVIILIASIHSYAFFHQPWVSLPILCLIVYQVLWEVCWRSERCKWQVIFTPWCVPTQLLQWMHSYSYQALKLNVCLNTSLSSCQELLLAKRKKSICWKHVCQKLQPLSGWTVIVWHTRTMLNIWFSHPLQKPNFCSNPIS